MDQRTERTRSILPNSQIAPTPATAPERWKPTARSMKVPRLKSGFVEKGAVTARIGNWMKAKASTRPTKSRSLRPGGGARSTVATTASGKA